ncbi:MAG: peptidylprolyl isomerase, partial [Bacteroidaceae bacterium]|nr:peptidylprolyl isomerase [Bacteroidaceae bacterium]
LAGAITSNPIAVKADFDARINESEIVIAALPYTSIKDADVTVDEKEMKAKFAEQKQLFETTEETRSIKYVDVEVTASKEDEANLVAELEGYATALKEGADAAKTVREAASLVAYSTLPIRKEALPHEVGEMLDSLTVGAQVGPFYHAHDNTYNIVRLIDKVTRPDSVEVRQIVALGSDMEKMQQTADSIINALNAGANFDSIAKKYDQPATKNWISSAQYEGQLMDAGNKLYIETISNAAVGSYNKIVLEGQAVLVVQVTDRRNMVSKYDVAVIKRAKDFSKDTYNKAFNDFSRFLAGNTTLEDIEANAEKEGYKVQTRTNISSTEHYVANVKSTREAMRWLFNEDTKINDISPLYECGDNDHLLCIVLTGINEKGYMSLDDEQVKSYIDAQIKKDKKAAILTEKMKNAKSVAEVAKMEGAVTDTIRNVSFAHNAFISKTGASEPALSGAVSKSKKGEFKACVKGNNAIYAYQVLDQTKRDEQFDAKKEMSQMSQINMRAISNYTQELYKKANVVDNRYIFY